MTADSLYVLLLRRRGDLLARWKEWVRAEVAAVEMTTGELVDSMPLFMDELIGALAPAPDGTSEHEQTVGVARAQVHGGERLRLGFDVVAVVREYNLLVRAILDLAEAEGQSLSVAEYRTVCNVVGYAQAAAVAEYQRKRDGEQRRQAAEHLAFLAHELRSPLSGALSAFTLMRAQLPAAAARQTALLDRGLRRISELLDEALMTGRLATGELIARAEPVDLTACVRQVAEEHAAEAEQRGMTLTVEVEDALTIAADGRLLRSLLSNLVGNAIKFSQPRSAIIVRTQRSPGVAIIEVEDGCGGLPPDKVTAIFDPHVQIGADRSGFGLGLAIAKQAAEAHGGTLQVQNLEGKGCCFRLELPAPHAPDSLP